MSQFASPSPGDANGSGASQGPEQARPDAFSWLALDPVLWSTAPRLISAPYSAGDSGASTTNRSPPNRPIAATAACVHCAGLAPCTALPKSRVPPAPRPHWLPMVGPGQRNVDPLNWSLSVAQWIFFLRACVATDTWKALKATKGGEYKINMYDINEHFVKPWTKGTGCSIALLMNKAVQKPVEGMLSHAWAGSVIETYNCLQNMVNHSGVPSTARFFFCTFSMYQPEDGAYGAPSIAEQVAMNPFMHVIESKPAHGMFVIHTTISEVYERLWVTHEADVATEAKIQMRGLFDMYRWTVEKFELATAVRTSEGKCGVERDRAHIEGLIMQRGGYERLDDVISTLRQAMRDALSSLLAKKKIDGNYDNLGIAGGEWGTQQYDWQDVNICDVQNNYQPEHEISWRFRDTWASAAERVARELCMDESSALSTLAALFDKAVGERPTHVKGNIMSKVRLPVPPTALPLGEASFPLGPREVFDSAYH